MEGSGKRVGEKAELAENEAVEVLKGFDPRSNAFSPDSPVNGVRLARASEPPRRVEVVVVPDLFHDRRPGIAVGSLSGHLKVSVASLERRTPVWNER
jgi:hypothetical protein